MIYPYTWNADSISIDSAGKTYTGFELLIYGRPYEVVCLQTGPGSAIAIHWAFVEAIRMVKRGRVWSLPLKAIANSTVKQPRITLNQSTKRHTLIG